MNAEDKILLDEAECTFKKEISEIAWQYIIKHFSYNESREYETLVNESEIIRAEEQGKKWIWK